MLWKQQHSQEFKQRQWTVVTCGVLQVVQLHAFLAQPVLHCCSHLSLYVLLLLLLFPPAQGIYPLQNVAIRKVKVLTPVVMCCCFALRRASTARSRCSHLLLCAAALRCAGHLPAAERGHPQGQGAQGAQV
jgi:hypothetical protein